MVASLKPAWPAKCFSCRMKRCSSTIVVLTMSVLSLCARQTTAPPGSSGVRAPGTVPPIPLPSVTVTGTTNGGSLTSPPISEAARKKKEVPGGFTIQGIGSLYQGRASSIDDLFQNAPGLVMLSENNVEISKVFIRGSGVFSEDEPAGVQYLIDGLTLNQGDGEIILEDFDVTTFKYAEVYRGANALQYGGLGLGGAVNFVPFTGYDAAPLAIRAEALAEDATPATPAMSVVLAVDAGRALVIEDDTAPALGTLSHSQEHTPVVPAMVPGNFPPRSTYGLTWWAQQGSNL